MRLYLIDDHTLFRQGLREILESQAGFEVIGEARSWAAAADDIAALLPDLVLMDVQIPGEEVTVSVAELLRTSPMTAVVILSMYDSPKLVQQLLDIGARGYFVKSVSGRDLIAAIQQLGVNHDHVVTMVSRESVQPQTRPAVADVLSERECAVLTLVAEGMSNYQVGKKLDLAEATVKRHMHNIFVKLGARSRVEAINKALAGGLISPRDPGT